MPSKKSMRVSMRKARYNRATVSAARTAVRRARRTISTGPWQEAWAAVSQAAGALDRAAKRRAMHRNTASRHKSRLAKRLQSLNQQGT